MYRSVLLVHQLDVCSGLQWCVKASMHRDVFAQIAVNTARPTAKIRFV